MQARLNQRLYKALPDELILAPSQKPYGKQNSTETDLAMTDEESTLNPN